MKCVWCGSENLRLDWDTSERPRPYTRCMDCNRGHFGTPEDIMKRADALRSVDTATLEQPIEWDNAIHAMWDTARVVELNRRREAAR